MLVSRPPKPKNVFRSITSDSQRFVTFRSIPSFKSLLIFSPQISYTFLVVSALELVIDQRLNDIVTRGRLVYSRHKPWLTPDPDGNLHLLIRSGRRRRRRDNVLRMSRIRSGCRIIVSVVGGIPVVGSLQKWKERKEKWKFQFVTCFFRPMRGRKQLSASMPNCVHSKQVQCDEVTPPLTDWLPL